MKSPKSQSLQIINLRTSFVLCSTVPLLIRSFLAFFGSLDQASSVFSNRVSPKNDPVVLLMLSLIEANNFGNNSYSHVQKDDVRNLIEAIVAMYGVISSTCVR